MRTALRLVLLATAFAAATMALGWWSVAAVGIVWGAVAGPGRHPVRTAAAAAALGWTGLLTITAVQGPVLRVAERVGGVMGVPWPMVVVMTLVFAGVVGGVGGWVGREVGNVRERGTGNGEGDRAAGSGKRDQRTAYSLQCTAHRSLADGVRSVLPR